MYDFILSVTFSVILEWKDIASYKFSYTKSNMSILSFQWNSFFLWMEMMSFYDDSIDVCSLPRHIKFWVSENFIIYYALGQCEGIRYSCRCLNCVGRQGQICQSQMPLQIYNILDSMMTVSQGFWKRALDGILSSYVAISGQVQHFFSAKPIL